MLYKRLGFYNYISQNASLKNSIPLKSWFVRSCGISPLFNELLAIFIITSFCPFQYTTTLYIFYWKQINSKTKITTTRNWLYPTWQIRNSFSMNYRKFCYYVTWELDKICRCIYKIQLKYGCWHGSSSAEGMCL